MKVLGITLAKGHSRGVPNKNLREIAGRPLLWWSLMAVANSKRIEHHLVSTDDDAIGTFCTTVFGHVGRIACVRRPTELAQDDTPSLSVIKYHLAESEALFSFFGGEFSFDAIALIPCTTPLRAAEDIDNSIQMLEDNPMADSVIGVTECVPIERVKKIVDGLIVDTYPEPQDGQRQNLEKCYTRSGIYVVRRDSLDKLFGHKTSLAYVLEPSHGVNIDNWNDWKLAEALLKEREGL